MKRLLLLLFVIGCASTSRSGLVAPACGPSAQNVGELTRFGFKPEKGKVTVFRIFATWCPYCHDDLGEIARRFASGEWSKDDVSVLLLAYRNRKEDRASFNEFKRPSIPGLQLEYVDQDHKELSVVKGVDGQPLLPEWRGVPYGMIFGKDGRMVFRGHFTHSPPFQAAHYKLIGKVAHESCR